MAVQRALGLNQLMRALNGDLRHLGVIQSTGTSATNSSTGTPFTVTPGWVLVVQPDAAGHLLCVAAGGAVTTTTGLKLAADEKFYVQVTEDRPLLAWISASGNANLRVMRAT